MRKTRWKTLLAAALFALLSVLCFSMTAAAEEDTFRFSGWVWHFDGETGTLTVEDALTLEEDDLLALSEKRWDEHCGEIRHVVHRADTHTDYLTFRGDPSLPLLETAKGSYNGADWHYDRASGELRITDSGPLDSEFAAALDSLVSSYPNAEHPLRRLTLDDRITTLPAEIRGWTALSPEIIRLGRRTVPIDELCDIALLSYEVPAGNSRCAVYENCLYSRDYKKLYASPRTIPNPALHPDMTEPSRYGPNGTAEAGGTTLSWKLDNASRTLTVSCPSETLPPIDGYDNGEYSYILRRMSLYSDFYDRLVIDGPVRFIEPESYRSSWTGLDVKTLVLNEYAEQVGNGASAIPTLAYEVSPDNPHLASYDGALYTKDFETLLSVPQDKPTIKFHPNLKTIATSAFQSTRMSPLILPEGVTTLQEHIFTSYAGVVVLPDTVTQVGEQYRRYSHEITYIYSDKLRWLDGVLLSEHPRDYYVRGLFGVETANEAIEKLYGSGKGSWIYCSGSWTYRYGDGSLATGWLSHNGCWYYFDQDGLMQTGWITDQGTRYYLNADGVMQTGPQQIDGVWYQFADWGGLL